MSKEHIWAVLTVAGRSRRMHEFKPLLPLGENTILEQTISRFHEAGIRNVVAVTGHRREEIAPVLQRMQVEEIYNPDYAVSDMLHSVKTGVQAVLQRKAAGIFISPGDSPLIHPFTIKQVMEAYETSDAQAVIPAFRGRDGHPPLLSGEAAVRLLNYDKEGGLRGFLEKLSSIERIGAVDSAMLLDADTPEDYRRLQAACRCWEIPDTDSCYAIWDYAGTPEQVRRHCRKVAELSLNAGKRAIGNVPEEEREWFLGLIQAGALLHDVMREAPAHETEGGRLLRMMGYGQTAEVVEAHRVPRIGEMESDLTRQDDLDYIIKRIVYCADRLTEHDTPCRYEERYDRKRRAFEGNQEALQTLERDRKRFWQCRQLLKEWVGYDLFE